MVPAVVITSMHRISVKPRADGSRLVATFDAEFADFMFVGCSLRVDPAGRTHACLPDARCRTPRGNPIVITNKALRDAMQREAISIYHASAQQADATIPSPMEQTDART